MLRGEIVVTTPIGICGIMGIVGAIPKAATGAGVTFIGAIGAAEGIPAVGKSNGSISDCLVHL